MKRVKLLKSQIISIITAAIFFLIAVGFGVLYLVKVNDKDNTPPTTLTPPTTTIDPDDGNVDYNKNTFRNAINKGGEAMMEVRTSVLDACNSSSGVATTSYSQSLLGQSTEEMTWSTYHSYDNNLMFVELTGICYSFTEYYVNYVDNYQLGKVYKSNIDIFGENRDVYFKSSQSNFGYDLYYYLDFKLPSYTLDVNSHYIHIFIKYDFNQDNFLSFETTHYYSDLLFDYLKYDFTKKTISCCLFLFVNEVDYTELCKKDIDYFKKNISAISWFDDLYLLDLADRSTVIDVVNIKESDFAVLDSYIMLYPAVMMYSDIDFDSLEVCFELINSDYILCDKDYLVNFFIKKYTLKGVGLESGIDGNDYFEIRGDGLPYNIRLAFEEIIKCYNSESNVFNFTKDQLIDYFGEDLITLLIDWYQNKYEDNKFYFERFKIGEYNAIYYQTNYNKVGDPVFEAGLNCLVLYKINEDMNTIDYCTIGDIDGDVMRSELIKLHITSEDTEYSKICYHNVYETGYSSYNSKNGFSYTYEELYEILKASDEYLIQSSNEGPPIDIFNFLLLEDSL